MSIVSNFLIFLQPDLRVLIYMEICQMLALAANHIAMSQSGRVSNKI